MRVFLNPARVLALASLVAGCRESEPTALSLGPTLDVVAATTTQITLISGNGSIGTQDPLNQFTLDGGATFQNAWIITPHPSYHVIPGTRYINRNPDFSGPENTATRYKTTFSLPSLFSSPSITVQVHADNVATVFVNGTQIGQQTFAEIFPNFQDPPEVFSTSDASLLHTGSNDLEFEVFNFHLATALDYKAVVSFATPANLVGGLIEQVLALRDAGVLTTDQADGLLEKLYEILAKLDAGEIGPAINQLEAFINQVKGFMNAGILASAQGQPLIDQAREIIRQLREGA